MLRTIGTKIATALLPVVLFSFGLTLSLLQVFGSPDHLKTALSKSGVYDTFLSDVLANIQTEGEQGEGIPVDRPEVNQIVQRAASPSFLQAQTEGFLDDLYAWIHGKSPTLQLEINLTEAKTKLTDGLTQYVNDRLAALPACPRGTPVNPESFDAFRAECVPPGMDRAAAAGQVRQELTTSEFLKDPVITQDDMKSQNGQSLEQQLQLVPRAYRFMVFDMWLSAALAVLCTAMIVLLSQTWRAGLRRAGIIFISVGASSAALAWFVAFVAAKLAENLAKSHTGEVQTSLAKIASILADDVRTWWLIYGLIVLLLGVAIILLPRFIKQGPDTESTGEDSKSPVTANQKTHTPLPQQKTSSRLLE